MVVGAAHQDFLPRLGVRGRHAVTICDHVDLLRRQLFEKNLDQLTQKRVAQTVDTFEMFKKKDKLLEMRCSSCRSRCIADRDSMRDLRTLQVPLQIEKVFADAFDIAMLLF